MKFRSIRLPALLLGAAALTAIAAGPASAQTAQPVNHRQGDRYKVAHRYFARHHGVRLQLGYGWNGYGDGPGAGATGTPIGFFLGAAAIFGPYDCAYGYPSAVNPAAYCPVYGYWGSYRPTHEWSPEALLLRP